MSSNRRSWVFGVVFWGLLLACIGLSDRYRWLDAAWALACFLLIAICSVLTIAEMIRNRGRPGEYVYCRGVPRCLRRFVLDDKQYAKNLEMQKMWDSKKRSSLHGEASRHQE
jgi:hypothetical protein